MSQTHNKVITTRVDKEVFAKVKALASVEGVTASDIFSDAVSEYLQDLQNREEFEEFKDDLIYYQTNLLSGDSVEDERFHKFQTVPKGIKSKVPTVPCRAKISPELVREFNNAVIIENITKGKLASDAMASYVERKTREEGFADKIKEWAKTTSSLLGVSLDI